MYYFYYTIQIQTSLNLVLILDWRFFTYSQSLQNSILTSTPFSFEPPINQIWNSAEDHIAQLTQMDPSS